MNTKYAGKTDEAVKKATGKTWDEWFKILDDGKVSKLPHREIVLWLHDKGLIKRGKGWPKDKSFNAGWWAQSIVVGYEEKIGRRVFGAKTAGNYTVTVGKSLDGSVDDAFKKWENLVKGKKDFNKIGFEGEPRTSSTKDWRYWKVDMEDGSKLMVGIGPSAKLRTSPKGDKQSAFSVTVDKLKGEKEVEKWRKYWKKFLGKL
jgi:hypothetical protein